METIDVHQAIEQGDEAALRALLAEDPARAGARDTQGVSAVMKSLYHRRRDLADLLRASAPAPDVFEAAALDDVASLRALLRADASLARAWSPDGGTALHFAAFFGASECARLLLQYGADAAVHATGFGNVAPIHSAAASRSISIVRMLLEHGAPVDAAQHGGWTALMAAAHRGDEPLSELLVEHGADPMRRADDGRDAVAMAEQGGFDALAERLKKAARNVGG
jgi:ankyrin repeat protein